MDRLSDDVCAKVADALGRMLALGEQVESFEFGLSVLPAPQGLVTVGLIHIALKGPVLGQALRNTDVVVDLNLLSQDGVDASVRASLDSLRSQKAQILVAANDHAH